MPRSSKKSDKKTTRHATSDIKLSDFANCSVAGRLRKSAPLPLNKEIEDEKLWFDRDIEEFEMLDEIQRTAQRKKNYHSKQAFQTSTRDSGVQYPIDVWFLISQFIKPEDVKNFASLCKDSYSVTRTYTFWIKMYKRYYKRGIHLPTRLQPNSIEGAFCLKMYVIRALYHMYPHFTMQVSTRPSSADVYALSNLCCTSMWREPLDDGKWLFHFKFQSPSTPSQNAAYIVAMWSGSKTLCDQENCVNLNPNEGCKILKLLCSSFVVVSPCVMGCRLLNVNMSLAHDMRRHKLRLTFCYSNYKPSLKQRGDCGDIVEFDQVETVAVLNWWHPQYPSA